MRTRFNAIVGDTVELKYLFTRNGAPYDIHQWTKVEIYDVDPRDFPSAVPLQTVLPAGIERVSTGLYRYVMSAVSSAKEYYDKQYYVAQPNTAEMTDVEQVPVYSATPPTPPPACLTKVGYTFQNYVVPTGEWGVVATPDDMRHTMLFGIDLFATNGVEVQDTQLAFAVDAATRELERYLGIDIRKRVYRTNPDPNLTSAPKWRPGLDYTNEEDVYPFRPDAWKNYGFIQLRHYPVQSLERMVLYTVTHTVLFNVLEQRWARLEKEAGQVFVFPSQYSFPYGPPGLASMGGGWLWLQGSDRQYPGGFEIDYTTGYKNSDWVPDDVRQVVMTMAAIFLLNWVGDGLMAGFSSSSIGIDGLSEAFSSTQSATSALFGARILEYRNQLKKQLPEIKWKFTNIPISFI